MLRLRRFMSFVLLAVTMVSTIAAASTCEATHLKSSAISVSQSVVSSASVEQAQDHQSHSQSKESHQGHCHCSNQVCCGYLVSKIIEVVQDSPQNIVLSALSARPFSWNENPLIRPPAILI